MEMTDNNNNYSTPSKEPLHLEQPLLSPQQHRAEDNNNNGGTHQRNFGGGGPRILDRDGTFAQSRGRWSVSNTRQRYHSRVTGSANNHRNDNDDDGGPPAFFATSHPRRLHNATTSSSPFQRLCTRLACCNSSYCFAKSNNSRQQQPRNSSLTRRCWDDWFHTLSYTPTCILMLGVFAAYFITIVIFAGLYLAVNKVGERYNNGDNGGGVNPNELDVAAAGE